MSMFYDITERGNNELRFFLMKLPVSHKVSHLYDYMKTRNIRIFKYIIFSYNIDYIAFRINTLSIVAFAFH